MPDKQVDGIKKNTGGNQLDLKKSRKIVLEALGEIKEETPPAKPALDSVSPSRTGQKPKPEPPKPKPVSEGKKTDPSPRPVAEEKKPEPPKPKPKPLISQEKKQAFRALFSASKSGPDKKEEKPEAAAPLEKELAEKESGLRMLDGINLLKPEKRSGSFTGFLRRGRPEPKQDEKVEAEDPKDRLIRKKLEAKLEELKSENIGFDQLAVYQKERAKENSAVKKQALDFEKEQKREKKPKPSGENNKKYQHARKLEEDKDKRENYEKKVAKEIKNYRRHEKDHEKERQAKASRNSKEAGAPDSGLKDRIIKAGKEIKEEKTAQKEKKRKEKQELKKERQRKAALFKQKAKIFRNRLIDAAVNGLWYTAYIILGFLVVYIGLFLLITRFRIDNQASRFVAEQLNFPIYLTEQGVISYRQYQDLRSRLLEQDPDISQEQVEQEITKNLILNDLSRKYNIEISERKFKDQEFMDYLKVLLIKDGDVNMVGLNRIRKIEESLKNNDDLNRVVSLADKQGHLTIELDSMEGEAEKALAELEPGEISGIIYEPEGYYIYKCFSKSQSESALSYLFIQAKDLESYLEEKMSGFRIFSLID